MAASPAVVTKTFTPSTIQPGEVSVLTITIVNPNNGADFNDLAFTDNYPPGLINAPSPSPSTDSGGVVTAVAGGTSLSLSGGFIPAGAGNSVTVTVNVTSNIVGSYLNETGSVSEDIHPNPSNSASGTLTVIAAPTPTPKKRRRIVGARCPDEIIFKSATTNPQVKYCNNVYNFNNVDEKGMLHYIKSTSNISNRNTSNWWVKTL